MPNPPEHEQTQSEQCQRNPVKVGRFIKIDAKDHVWAWDAQNSGPAMEQSRILQRKCPGDLPKSQGDHQENYFLCPDRDHPEHKGERQDYKNWKYIRHGKRPTTLMPEQIPITSPAMPKNAVWVRLTIPALSDQKAHRQGEEAEIDDADERSNRVLAGIQWGAGPK